VPADRRNSPRRANRRARVGWAKARREDRPKDPLGEFTQRGQKNVGCLTVFPGAMEKLSRVAYDVRDQRTMHRDQGHLVRRGLPGGLHPPNSGRPRLRRSQMLYMDPEECIDCDDCVEARPIDAITSAHVRVSDANGSSRSTTSGSTASARAKATRCCWPPESWWG